jgi:hypothetical protein
MPLWVWGLAIIYLSLLFFAALWAAVERTHSHMARTRRLTHAEPPSDDRNRSPSEAPQP